MSETLPEYVEEKTGGKFRKEAVACISLKDLHEMNFDRIQQQLMDVKDFNKVVVNAVDYPDLKVFCVALLRAMAAGKNFCSGRRHPWCGCWAAFRNGRF